MKKRIGNDIHFTWNIYRKNGETQVPEDFTGKDVEVKLMSPLKQPVTIEDVTIATGVVTFTFRGKHQVTLGNYVAVLQENKGENGMATLDVVDAVTLVPHSYMEEDNDEGDVISATSVELESEIGQGIDAYTKTETDALLEGKYDKVEDVAIYDNGISVGKKNGVGSTLIGGNKLTFFEDALGNKQGSIFLYDGYLRLQDNARGYHVNGRKIATEVELAGKQDTIDDLATIRSGAQAGATAYQKPSTGIPATDLVSDVQNDLAAIDGIEEVIPVQASSNNQLADKDFVNSSIATATATYRGSYNLVTDLHLSVSATHTEIATALATAIQIADNNDYCYVQIPVADATPTEFASVERYKFNGTVWDFEYALNNSGFTAAQWAALNSGITSGLVAKLSDLPTATELATLLAGKASTSDLAEVATSGSYNDLSDKPDLSAFITKSVNDLTNYYLKSETYTKTEVQQLIGAIQQFHYEVYPTLPQTGASNVLYLIGPIGTGTDKYEEYVYANNDWTKIGDTSIDLSGYVTTQALNTALADYVTASALSTILANYYNKTEVDGLFAGKEDVTTIVTPVNATDATLPITTLTCEVGNYYRIDVAVDTLAITLPAINSTVVKTVVIYLTAGTTPAITISSSDSKDVYYQDGFEIEAGNIYEINALFNGAAWIVASVKINVE